MFDNIKKFARKYKYKFIIAGIAIALVGAFLAWFVNLAFLTMIFLSFIWSGYFYSLGAEQHIQIEYNRENQKIKSDNKDLMIDKNSQEKLKVDSVVNEEKTQTVDNIKNREIKSDSDNRDLKAENISEVKLEVNNSVIEEKVNYDVDEQMVSWYIQTLISVGKSEIKEDVSIICNLLKSTDQGSRGNDYFFDIVALHLNTIPWNTYSPELIAKNIKQIAGIMTNKSVEEIDEYVCEYRKEITKGKKGYKRIELSEHVWEMLGCRNYGNTHNACVNVITLAEVIDKVLERREKILNSIPKTQLTEILNARKFGSIPRMQEFGGHTLSDIESSLKL